MYYIYIYTHASYIQVQSDSYWLIIKKDLLVVNQIWRLKTKREADMWLTNWGSGQWKLDKKGRTMLQCLLASSPARARPVINVICDKSERKTTRHKEAAFVGGSQPKIETWSKQCIHMVSRRLTNCSLQTAVLHTNEKHPRVRFAHYYSLYIYVLLQNAQ